MPIRKPSAPHSHKSLAASLVEMFPTKTSNVPLTSSFIGSTVDTFLFFSISFYATGIPWVTLSLGDLTVKIFVALVMLIPFRLLLGTLKPA